VHHLHLKAAAELPVVAATSVHLTAAVGLPVAAVALLAAAVGEPVAAVAARQLRQNCSQKQKVKQQWQHGDWHELAAEWPARASESETQASFAAQS